VKNFVMVSVDLMARADLTPAAKWVYTLLADYARIKNSGEAWPGVRAIMAKTGLASHTVHQALVILQTAGLIKVKTRGSGRRTTVYQVFPPDTPRPTGSAQETAAQTQTRSALTCAAQTGDSAERKTAKSERKQPRSALTCAAHSEHINTKQQTEQERAAPAAAVDKPSSQEPSPEGCVPSNLTAMADGGAVQATPAEKNNSQVRQVSALEASKQALADFGVGEPNRTRLAELDGMTPELVQNVGIPCQSGGGGPGLLVRRLQDAVAERTRERQGYQRHDESQPKYGYNVSSPSVRRREEIAEWADHYRAEFRTAVARLYLDRYDPKKRRQAWEAFLAKTGRARRFFEMGGWEAYPIHLLHELKPGYFEHLHDEMQRMAA
jgi:DNA-binding transcriptional regulator YhcF (GntR family)